MLKSRVRNFTHLQPVHTGIEYFNDGRRRPEAIGERLPEFSEAGRDSLLQQLYSEAPIYEDLDQVLLADSIARTLEARGFDDPVCQQILAGKSPSDRAAELIQGTKLKDVANRKALVEGGLKAVEGSTDPLIKLARTVIPEIRRYRAITDQLDEQDKQAYAKVAEAKFATQGTSTYPDATFTLRLAFGPVAGYEQNGENIPAWTKIGGTYEHEARHKGRPITSCRNPGRRPRTA